MSGISIDYITTNVVNIINRISLDDIINHLNHYKTLFIGQLIYFTSIVYVFAKEYIILFIIRLHHKYANSIRNIYVCLIILIFLIFFMKYKNSDTRLNRQIKQLRECKKSLSILINHLNCHPILLRLAWADIQSYNKNVISKWPECGGSNGSIQYDYELHDITNIGLQKAIDILKPLKIKYNLISWADLIQMGGVLAVELSGGPIIPIRYGRLDAPPNSKGQKSYNKSFRSNSNISVYPCIMPKALPPYPDFAPAPEIHLRNVFYRIGCSNREIVALMGGHTIGRAFKDRSGVCIYSSGEQGATQYTRQTSIAKANGQIGIGMPGGQSWTKLWLQFDNSYYHHINIENNKNIKENSIDNELLWLPTDQSLYDDPEFRPYFINYSKDQDLFFKDFSNAFKRMSELGAKFNPIEGIFID